MKERPILFSGPMIRALLDDSKTQTRRALKMPHGLWETSHSGELVPIPVHCHYGQPGGRLWVREAWRTTGDGGRCNDMPPRELQPHPIWYEAAGKAPADECVGKYRPPMFMPRWASRILLEITEVRVERLQDISEADALAEGSRSWANEQDTPVKDIPVGETRLIYRQLWEQINGAGSWDINPWVWVVSFRRLP